jgi:hypothetical protein
MNIILSLYERFNILVPNPQVCIMTLNDYDTRVWNDTRPEPTLAQVLAVTQVQLDADLINPDNGNIDWVKMQKLNFQVNYDQESRMRVIETTLGIAVKNPITKAQYLTALVAVYKTL